MAIAVGNDVEDDDVDDDDDDDDVDDDDEADQEPAWTAPSSEAGMMPRRRQGTVCIVYGSRYHLRWWW